MRKPILVIGIAVIALLAGIVIFNRSSSSGKKPNVVFIIIDTLRADKLGSYGVGLPLSPELDSLAQQGVLYERVISQSSWTRPSIGSMLTSIQPRILGIFKEQWDKLGDQFVTLAETLKENGYYTIGVTANPNINSFFNFNQGFNIYIDSDVVFPWMDKVEGKRAATKTNRPKPATDIFRIALEQLEQHKGDLPIYLQINIMDVHAWHRMRPENIDADLRDQKDARYLQTVRVASREVGKFVEAVKNLPGLENTLFVITSDHGEGLSDHPAVPKSTKHGNLLYESHVIVPLILYNSVDPDLTGKRISQPVRQLELMPTILDYLGIKPPTGVEGVSTLPAIKDPTVTLELPENFVTETNWRNVDKIAVYTDGWKYIENRDNWPGVNPKELQLQGGLENGVLTDQISNQPEVASHLERGLSSWEKIFPKGHATASKAQPSNKEVEQLRSLGYLK